MKNMKITLLLLSGFLFLGSCKVWNNLNLYTPNDDVALGKQVVTEIEANPKEYPLLPERGNEAIYKYVRGISRTIVNSGQLQNKGAFAWQVKIIQKDDVLNAFCTPGGYIYVYTGLIKYLDAEDQLAGVLGHEIAHADRRHSTNMMTQMLGPTVVAELVLGKQKLAKDVLNTLVQLQFSRTHETEADEYSVKYLCNTPYNAAGCAAFFEKMGNKSSPPEFLSTHPNPENRVQKIKALAASKGCRGKETRASEYQKMKKMLP